MAVSITHPNAMQFDTDPFEQLNEALKNPLIQPHLKPDMKIRDQLSRDIRQQLKKEGRLFWFPENWLDCLNEEATRIINEFNLSNKDYVVKVGTKTWVKEIWALSVVLRYRKSGQVIRPSSSWMGDSLEEAIKFLYESAESGLSFDSGLKSKRVMLLLTGRAESPAQTRLLALYSKADKRFAQLCTILGIWKDRRFDKVDSEGVFSHYAFALMLIQFLQVGCYPPVLPCLHQMNIDLLTCRPSDIKFKSENKKSLGNLLFNFFNFYQMKASGGFDFDHWKVSVKAGEPIKLGTRSRTFYIEDPLEKKSQNVVEFLNSPGISYILAFTFAHIRTRLMTKRRLKQLEYAVVI